MAIDVLSHANTAPIIVGDVGEMSDLQGVGSEGGAFHLVMAGPNGTHNVPLSPGANENFSTAKHMLLVCISGDQITTARRVSISNLNDGHDLSAEQRRDLAKGLSLPSREFRSAALAEFRESNPELVAA